MNNEVFHASVVMMTSLLTGAWLIKDGAHWGIGIAFVLFGTGFAMNVLNKGS